MKKIIVKYRSWLFTATFIYILCAIIETVFAIFLGKIIDNAIAGHAALLIKHAVVAVAMVSMNLILYRVAIASRRTYVMKSVSGIKAELMRSLFLRGLSSFQENSDSYYINLLSNDIDVIENDYLLLKPTFLFYIAQFVFSLSALIYISWKATLLFLVFFLIPIIIPQTLSSLLAKRNKIVSDQNENFTFVLKEYIQGMSDIVQNLSIHAFLRKFNDANILQQSAKKKAGITQIFINELSNGCNFIAQLGCIAVGGILSIQGEISIGELVAAIQLLNSVLGPIGSFSQMMATMSGTKPIRNKLDKELSVECDKVSTSIKLSGSLIYNNFSTWYEKGQPIIKDFSYTFNEGKLYAVIGDSGKGKTTLFKCLLKLHDKYNGTIKIGEADLQSLSAYDICNHIGYVPQNAYLFNDSIEHNITMYADYPPEAIQNILHRVQLTYLADAHRSALGDAGAEISGGERQKILLARALIRQPQVIVFDEPTSALDPDTRDAINELIFSLNGYTRIVITHDRRQEYLNRFDEIISL